MKKIPKKIYLQIDPDGEKINSPCEGVTWCQDKINKTDVEYVLSGDNLASKMLRQNKIRIDNDISGVLPNWAVRMCEKEESNPYTDFRFSGESPFVENGFSLLLAKTSDMKYKSKKFKCIQFHYECQESKLCFTTDEIDEINIRIVLASYRNRMLLKSKGVDRNGKITGVD